MPLGKNPSKLERCFVFRAPMKKTGEWLRYTPLGLQVLREMQTKETVGFSKIHPIENPLSAGYDPISTTGKKSEHKKVREYMDTDSVAPQPLLTKTQMSQRHRRRVVVG